MVPRIAILMSAVTFAMLTIKSDGAEAFKWPQVQPVARSYFFSTAGAAEIKLPIQSVDGRPIYLFKCAPGDKHADGSIENLECGLGYSSYNPDEDDSLLTEDPFDGSIAHTRGEIWANELMGACAHYSEWGPSGLSNFGG